jgi:tetratricopeptide (TPR) repeat protein
VKKNRQSSFLCGVLLAVGYPVASWGSVPDATILRIQSEIESGKIDTAEAEIKAALKDNPDDGGLYNLQGIVDANRNEMKAAAADFEQAVHFRPRLVAAYLNLGRVCETLSGTEPGALDRAIDQYRLLLKLEPASHEVRLQLAKLLEQRGEFESSLQELARLPAPDRGRGLAVALLCTDLAGLRRMKEAEVAARALPGAPNLDEQAIDAVLPALLKSHADSVAIQMLTAVNQRQPLSYANLQKLAAAYERRSELPEARRILEKIVPADSADISVLMELARVAQKQNDLNGALGYLAHARDVKPDYAPIHFFFGVVCIELDLPLEAKKSLQKALDLDPENAIYNFARGSVELQGRAAWQAIPYFKKFVAAVPNDPRGHFALGAAEFASQDYDAAAKEMSSVVNGKDTVAGAQYFLGRIAKAEGDWAGASEHLQKSIEADPTYADSHAELGLARMHLDDLPGARRELNRALELNPNSYIANGNLLALFRRTKDPGVSSQEQRLRDLDLKRSEKQELMLRTIGISRYAN